MKLKRILGLVVVGILLVSGVISVMLYKVGDRVFDEMLEQALRADTENAIDVAPIPITPSKSGTANTAGQQKQEPTPAPTAPAAESSKQPAQSVGEASNATSVSQIPKQKIEEIKEDVTAADKMTIAALVLKKLTQQDISQLTKMAGGGITSEEKEKMKKIALERFTEEEINEIKGMYYKYMN